jgi:predicted membrane-bound mannosyltransferase
MAATKETFIITLAAAAIAILINQAWNRALDASGQPLKAVPLNPWHLVAGFGVCCAVALLLFTSFFTNLSGPLDSIRTYLPWAHRAAGESPHVHPWYFYLRRLLFFHLPNGPVWSEALIFLLAVVGAIAGFRRQNLAGANASLLRFIALYTFLLAAFYSLLAYKTPWCLLSFWLGAILLAGVGAGVLIQRAQFRTWRLAMAGVLLAGLAHLGWQSWRAETTYAADPRNPYVYAQTSPDLLNLVNQLEGLAGSDSRGHKLVVKIMSRDGDYWPLPWYLRRFDNIGWWDHVPEDPFAPVMVVSAQFHAALDEKKTHLMVGYFQLRPQLFFELYVELDLWKEWLSHRTAETAMAAQ